MYVCRINVCAKVYVFMYECGMFVGILYKSICSN